MKIGLIADDLDSRLYGPGNYTYNLVKNILALDNENEYTLVHSLNRNGRQFREAGELLTPPVRFLPSAIGRPLAREALRTFVLRRKRFDLVHELTDLALATPLLFPLKSRKLITFFDLEPFLFPENFAGGPVGTYYRFILPKILEKVDSIVTISQTTKDDLISHLHLPGDKITAVSLGVDHSLFKPDGKQPYPFPYFLHIGTEHPMKNLATALLAFHRLRQEPAHKELKFLRVGATSAVYRERTKRLAVSLGLLDQIVFTDYVPKEDLPGIYSNAEFLIFPSLYEGFGLPVLEAMACGTPVLAANAGSLPEVVGDAGIIVDPLDADGFAAKAHQILTDPALRADLVKKGLARARQFTWQKTAEATLNVYRSVAG